MGFFFMEKKVKYKSINNISKVKEKYFVKLENLCVIKSKNEELNVIKVM